MADSSGVSEWFITSVRQLYPHASDSECQWMQTLRVLTDTECMCVLQGKSISSSSSSSSGTSTPEGIQTTPRTNKDCIDLIKNRAHVISCEFSKVYRKVQKDHWKHVHAGTVRLTCHIRSLVQDCFNAVPQHTTDLLQYQQLVLEECAKLAQYVEGYTCDLNGPAPDRHVVQQLLTQLGSTFSTLVDIALGSLVQRLLLTLEEEDPETMRSSLTQLVSLGLEGDHLCYIIAREGGLQVLFTMCQLPRLQYVHSQVLRAIATICCVPESIAQLEQLNGIECLTELLTSPHQPEAIRCEAAGVIAQVTSPALDHVNHLAAFIDHMHDLVKALTDLCIGASSPEVLLLGCAALGNITFMDPLACDLLLHYHTAKVLVDACSTPNAHSVFTKDQVVTVVANMAVVDSCLDELLDCDAPRLLVNFLHIPPPDGATTAEMRAFEHVQQKSAIGVSRMARDKDAVQKMVDLKLIPRLVVLCKKPSERENSDAVLLACLAALRKLCSHQDVCVDDELSELITPKLVESFVLCTVLDESIV